MWKNTDTLKNLWFLTSTLERDVKNLTFYAGEIPDISARKLVCGKNKKKIQWWIGATEMIEETNWTKIRILICWAYVFLGRVICTFLSKINWWCVSRARSREKSTNAVCQLFAAGWLYPDVSRRASHTPPVTRGHGFKRRIRAAAHCQHAVLQAKQETPNSQCERYCRL
jgi:hypothetical protein